VFLGNNLVGVVLVFKGETVNKDIERLQIIEFQIGSALYGVNILKVKEIMVRQKLTQVPSKDDISKGVFHYRGEVIPVINVHKMLGDVGVIGEEARLIVLHFNNMLVSFEVDKVIGTYVLDWKQVRKVDNDIVADDALFMGVVVKPSEDLVLLIDFESVMYKLKPVKEVSDLSEKRVHKKIMVADDSDMMSKLIREALTNSGYTNLVSCKDGAEALQLVENTKDIDCFILDVEMPFHNGYTVTKRIRENHSLKEKPVVLFSSLINKENLSKGAEAGATIQISKPDIVNLVREIDKLLI